MVLRIDLLRRRAKAWGIIACLPIVCLVAACSLLGGGGDPEYVVPLPEIPIAIADAGKQSVLCAECHIDIGAYFKEDVHSGGKFSCVTCHGISQAHLAQKVEGARPDRTWRHWDEENWQPRVKNAPLEISRFCASCHAESRSRKTWATPVDWAVYLDSGHGWAVRDGNADAPGCTDCHATHSLSDKPWSDEQVTDLCAPCHEKQGKGFAAGKHGAKHLEPGEKLPPNCLPCHRPH